MCRFAKLGLLAVLFVFANLAAAADPLPIVTDVEWQPLAAQIKRVVQALQLVGSPLDHQQQAAVDKALANTDAAEAVRQIQAVLDPLCLAGVNISPESRVKVARGPAAARLAQHGWRTFLVKVNNEAGVTAALRCQSPNAVEPKRSSNKASPAPFEGSVRDQWLAIDMYQKQPLNRRLSGLRVEYRIVSLYSRDAGRREAKLLFDVGQGTQDLGFRNELSVLFQIAAGCKHYDVPSQGVTPEHMMRHILGEDLNVGCVLSWGPCWYYQKQFFSGEIDKLSTKTNLMRYDVEVSGFPSQHAGHLCLLRLTEDDYTYPKTTEFDWKFRVERGHFKGTKTESIGEWPTWDLPILRWGKEQGAVVGFSHSGWGLKVNATSLPTFEMPPFDGIGANEYIVDVTHGVCDFISAVDTPSVWELNIWYHTLNCGYTTRISGETDFPCIYGERVGLGRAYVKLPRGRPLNYDEWVHGIRDGRSYCCDGLSHLIDFSVGGLGVGEKGADGRPSVLAAKRGGALEIKVKAAGLLAAKPNETIRKARLDQKPYWHIERARIGDSRTVPVELIVNGRAVARQVIDADGSVHDLTFDYKLKQSSWVALRIFPSAHTNPVFVEVDSRPIRASKKSARWCLEAVDVCWKQKEPQIRQAEKAAAAAAFESSRGAYRKILAEAFDDE